MLKIVSAALITFTVSLSWANDLQIEQEQFYDSIRHSLIEKRSWSHPSLDLYPQCYDKKLACQTGREIFIQAMDDVLQDGLIEPEIAEIILSYELLQDIPLFDYLHILTTFKESLPQLWNQYEPELKERLQIAELTRSLDERTKNYLESHKQIRAQSWNDRYDIARALLTEEPPINTYWDGRYHLKPRIFMFCRDNRKQRCLMLIKDATGRLAKLRDGTPWTQQSLGFSRHKKDFHQTNGNTPMGVWRIDSVMPSADQQLVFGKFRRLILNFVGASSNEANIKKLLPAMTHNHQWWREGVIARNNGRGLFRVHGTGLRSSSRKPYFPMVPTAGCVAKAENTYNKIVYKDQRDLLDKLMIASGLNPVYANETRILGLLYVIDIDKKEEPVTLESLREVGIL